MTNRAHGLRTAVRLALLTLLVGLGAGCGGTEKPEKSHDGPGMDPNAIVHPKHPGVEVWLKDTNGSAGGPIWSERDGGQFLSTRAGSGGVTTDGEGVGYSQFYNGTTDEGDKYVFVVKVGNGEPQEKTVVYSGEETEIDCTGGVAIVLK